MWSLRSLLPWAIHGMLLFNKLFKNWMTTVLGRPQEWKTETTTYDRSGRPEKNFLENGKKSSTWSRGNSSRLNRGNPKGTEKHFVIDQGDLISILKKCQDLKISSWENEETELELSVGIKIIRESGEWSSAEKTEKNFQRCRRWRRTFYDLVKVYGCNDGISDIYGEKLPRQSVIPLWILQISHLKPMFCISAKISGRTRWDLRFGNNWLGKTFMENICPLIGDERISNLQRTKVYVFFQILYCVLGRTIRIRNLTQHGKKG